MGMALLVVYYTHFPLLGEAFYEVYPGGSVLYKKALYRWSVSFQQE